MWNEPTKEQLKEIPRLYDTEDKPAKDKPIYLHLFLGGSDWYIAEYDGEDLFFGYAILNGDEEMAEWGYVSFRELRSLKIAPGFEVECDAFWKVRKASEVDKIRTANYWKEPGIPRENTL